VLTLIVKLVLFIAVALVSMGWLGVSVMMYVLVRAMDSPKATLRPIEQMPYAGVVGVLHAWAQQHGFEWVGAFRFSTGASASSVVYVWRHREQRTYLCDYEVNGAHTEDFVSIYDQNQGLTTGSRTSMFALAYPPGMYVQCFPVAATMVRWDHHLQAEAWLMEHRSVEISTVVLPADQEIQAALRRQFAHLKTMPCWPLRTPWWLLTGHLRKSGKSVVTQLGGSIA